MDTVSQYHQTLQLMAKGYLEHQRARAETVVGSAGTRVCFPHVVEAIFSPKENSWCDLFTDTVAGTEILIYPYFYSTHAD